MMVRRTRALAVTLAIASLAALAGCARTMPISQVKERGEELRGRQVTVAGEVVDTVDLPLLRHRYYHLDDGTGQLWVQTTDKVPARGDHLQVTGVLTPGLHIPGLDVGLVLDETSRE